VLFVKKKKSPVELQTVKRDIPLGHTNESSATTRQQTIQQRKGVNAVPKANPVSEIEGERNMEERKHKNQR